jgi:polyisoprenoid-binding protein YceI
VKGFSVSILHQQGVDLPAGTWTLDPVHSSVGFGVEYMAGTFTGTFIGQWLGTH